MCAIEFLDCGVELLAFLPLYQQLGYLLAPLRILQSHLSHFPLLSRSPTLATRMRRSECIGREAPLVVLERRLRLAVPDLALLVRQVLPGEADDLRERAVVGLDLGGDMLALDER